MTLPALGLVDWVLLALMAVSVAVGVVRGFVFELLSLLGWVVAWFAAQWGSPLLAPHVPVGAPGSGLNAGVSFGLAFAGALRGGVLLLALATVVALTPASQSATWRGSQGARWLEQGLAVLKPLLPEAVSRHLRP